MSRASICFALLFLAVASAGANAQGEDDGRPLHLVSPAAEILILDRVSAGRLADTRLLGRLLDDCASRFGLAADVRAAAVAMPMPTRWATAPASDWMLEILAVPGDGTRAHCGGIRTAVHAGLARGLQVLPPDDGAALAPILALQLLIDGREVTTAVSEWLPLQRLGADGLVRVDSAARRIALPIEALVPNERGQLPTLAVRVRRAGDAAATLIPVPEREVLGLWKRALPARLARGASNLDSAARPTLTLPVPRDRYLAAARSDYLDGDLTDGARLALVRLDDDTLNVADTRAARVMVGVAFAAQRDEVGARLLLAPLVREEPCFALAPGVAPEAEAVLARLARPRASCRPGRPLRVAIQGALVPGFGRPASRTRIAVGLLELGVMALFIARSQEQLRQANAQYQEYLDVSILTPVPEFVQYRSRRLYDAAEGTRRAAESSFNIALGIWAVAAVEAVFSEVAWGAHFREISRFGQAP
jgi:hypothetical protein